MKYLFFLLLLCSSAKAQIIPKEADTTWKYYAYDSGIQNIKLIQWDPHPTFSAYKFNSQIFSWKQDSDTLTLFPNNGIQIIKIGRRYYRVYRDQIFECFLTDTILVSTEKLKIK